MASAYDLIAEQYALGRGRFDNATWLRQINESLSPTSRVLDLGCGSGVPVSKYLADRGHRVIGIDISPRQIELARLQVPDATFEVADMEQLSVDQYRVDGIVAFYSIYHVPRILHAELYRTLRSFIPHGGLLFALIGTKSWEGSKRDFYGTEMRWSAYEPDVELQLMINAGFVIESCEFDATAGEKHLAVQARAD